MADQFKIKDPDKRIVAGWASVQVKDVQGDLIPVDVLDKAMYDYMSRGGHLMYGHSSMPVGKVLRWEIKEHPVTKKQGLWIEAQINKGYKIDDEVWDMIKRGEIKGFSIGGYGKEEKMKIKSDDGKEEEVDLVTYIELSEISLVEKPANPYATIEKVNYYAKGEAEPLTEKICIDKETLLKELEAELKGVSKPLKKKVIKKLEEIIPKLKDACKSRYYDEDAGHFKEMTCPDGGGPNRFCGCVRYQMNCNNKSLDSAKRICAKIYHEKYGKGITNVEKLDLSKIGKARIENVSEDWSSEGYYWVELNDETGYTFYACDLFDDDADYRGAYDRDGNFWSLEDVREWLLEHKPELLEDIAYQCESLEEVKVDTDTWKIVEEGSRAEVEGNIKKADFNVGDKVRFKEDPEHVKGLKGKVGVVVDYMPAGDYWVEVKDGVQVHAPFFVLEKVEETKEEIEKGFNVGDRVKIVEEPFARPDVVGKEGVIVEIIPDKSSCIVRLDDGSEVLVGLEKLELVEKSSIEKSDDLIPVKKPFGKWKDFYDCVEDMKRQYADKYSGEKLEEVARRVCGKLQAELEKKGEFINDANDNIGGDGMSEEEVKKEEVLKEEEVVKEDVEGDVKIKPDTKEGDKVVVEAKEGEGLEARVAALEEKVAQLVNLVTELTRQKEAAKPAEEGTVEVETGKGINVEKRKELMKKIAELRKKIKARRAELLKKKLKERRARLRKAKEVTRVKKTGKAVETPAPATVVGRPEGNEEIQGIVSKILKGEIKPADLPKVLKDIAGNK